LQGFTGGIPAPGGRPAAGIYRKLVRPAVLLIREGTFETPPTVATVLSSGMLTVLTAQPWAWAADHAHRGFGYDWSQIAVAVFKLRLTRPDMVVRRGLRPGTSVATGADPGFTAWAINLYAARPDYRPMIGTHDGLRIFGDR
jgi:hypothetical protein